MARIPCRVTFACNDGPSPYDKLYLRIIRYYQGANFPLYIAILPAYSQKLLFSDKYILTQCFSC
jgi:hypothetical protein